MTIPCAGPERRDIMGLSIRDILILDYFDGKPLHHRIPPYKLHIYGPDANTRIDSLMEDGWIRSSRPQETVNMLPDKVLSDFLKRYDLSGEGTHAELTGRVISKIPEKDYAHGVPRIYVLTREGKAEIGHHMAYVLNVRENYGLTEGEIGESQNALTQRGEPFTARDILCRAFQQKIALYTSAGEGSKLRNRYYTVANFYLRIKDKAHALPYLYLVFFMDMSGMGNKNNLVPYENLFPTQKGMILLMDEIRKELHLTLEDVKTSFLSSIARMAPRLPFSYFSPQMMASMLLERLRGRDFNGTRYIADRNVPDPSSKSYHYVPYGRSEAKTPLRRTPAVKPKIMAPPVLRMPTFTAPPPFRPSENTPPLPKVPRPGPEKPVMPKPSRKEKKGLLDRIKDLF